MCNTQTYGVFNPAKEIIKKMKEREAAMGSDEEPDNEQEPSEENWKRKKWNSEMNDCQLICILIFHVY